MSRLNDIADAVVALLNENGGSGGSLGQTFVSERVYVPIYDHKTSDALEVQVLGLEEQAAIITRSDTDRHYVIHVAIYKKIDNNGEPSELKAELDSLSDFREKVLDLFLANSNKRLPTYSEARLVEANVVATYDAGMIERGTFITVVRLTYRLSTSES